MIRLLFITGTLGFWLAIAAFRLAAPEPARIVTEVPAAPGYALATVAGHRTQDDCWMVIDGVVYDLSAYLPRHPADPALFAAWCGRDASEAYSSKGIGRPHSARADDLLAQYRIGGLLP